MLEFLIPLDPGAGGRGKGSGPNPPFLEKWPTIKYLYKNKGYICSNFTIEKGMNMASFVSKAG